MRPTIRCLVRDPRRAPSAVDGSSVQAITGTLGDAEALAELVRDADVVYHLAGATRAFSRRGFIDTNCAGTARLVDAVLHTARSPCRFVHVSSLAAAGASTDGRQTDRAPDHARGVRSDYGDSKRLGERHVAAVSPDRLDWIVLRPGIVYGSGDEGTRLLFRQACAPVVAVPSGRRPLSLIHVDDLVTALLAAGDRRRSLPARADDRFIPLEGPDRSDTSALQIRIARACGRAPAWRLPLPGIVAGLGGLGGELVARLRRRPGFLCRDKLRDVYAEGWVADPTPARLRLDFVPRITLDDGLRMVANAERPPAEHGDAV